MAGIKEVVNNADWSEGSRLHSIYMVNTDDITHDPDSSNQWFTDAGKLAAKNGNIAATEWNEANYIWAMNYWMSAPFHGLPILDPELTAVGFGFFSKASSSGNNIGGVNVAATLDVMRGIVSPSFELIQFPIFFPPDGGETWVLKHDLYEYPSPLASCPGYSRPTGPPIMIQTGTGGGRPIVTSYSFTSNGNAASACMFTEATYTNSDPTAQQSGRGILNTRDAVVIIPFNPLVRGNVYKATVTIDGVTYSSEFTAVAPPY
jgi:Cysteine-rich secretory protein family